MKKIWIIAFLGLSLVACKKDKSSSTQTNTPLSYEDKLVGSWDLTAIYYETEIPDFGGGAPIPVEDNGTNVSGEFNIIKDPNQVSYDYSFTASIPNPLTGGSFDAPVSQQASGTWTVASDNSAIYLKSGEETTTFKVMKNEADLQVFQTVIPYSVPILGTVEVTALITLTRQN
ncbi:MAG: lipocalin family protein [Owenweeksia sp.]